MGSDVASVRLRHDLGHNDSYIGTSQINRNARQVGSDVASIRLRYYLVHRGNLQESNI